MKLKPFKRAPVILAVFVLTLVCGARLLQLDIFERLERMTYDLRVRAAMNYPAPAATNLAFVSIEDSSIAAVQGGKLGYHFGLYWPRQVYGRLVEELSAEGARTIAFDVLFGELRHDHPPVQMAEGGLMESDDFFAAQMRHAGNVLLAVVPDLVPPDLFLTNALAPGDISTERDSDGVLRRVRAFDDQGVWDMGIVLAALELKLDLAHPDLDLAHGRITLQGAKGVKRVIPVDRNGYFYIDWRLKVDDPRLRRAPIENLLLQDRLRLLGRTNGLHDDFRGTLVVVGSAAQGNDLTDRGATPLEKDTLLVSKHWNVANSVITGQFIHRASLPTEFALIIFLGLLTAFLTWQLRAFAASGAVFLLLLVYVAVGFYVFVAFRYWLPLVFPVAGAMLVEHLSLVTYRVVFEEREQRRVKSVFSKIVSPDVMNVLLGAEKLSLGGARREVTIFFADVRGFTTLSDEMHQRVADFIQEHELDDEAADKCIEESAQETLETVNLYLATVADAVKKHGGTLDKYIGDCVMAFWGAPTPNDRHASDCVRAAIDAQRTIHDLNQKRSAQNNLRETENRARLSAGLPPRPPLRALQVGTGINTGLATVGLMGSDAHILNYTVFGREVNLASRLESVSGSGRIIISDTTYNHLLREDPALASTCVEMFPVTVKGIRDAVRIYEVPWQAPLAK
ncbi:MAG: adenylate/guanylate cyclase domain-containing protein [Verrucomicrobiia bacterium]